MRKKGQQGSWYKNILVVILSFTMMVANSNIQAYAQVLAPESPQNSEMALEETQPVELSDDASINAEVKPGASEKTDTAAKMEGSTKLEDDLAFEPEQPADSSRDKEAQLAAGQLREKLESQDTQLKQASVADGSRQAAGPFEVTGGVAGTDYSYSGTVLSVLTSTPLTLSTPAPTSSTIQINPGVHSEITLAGVRIQNASLPAINLITNINDTATGAPATDGSQIRNPTSLYLKIKDGSTNSLTTASPTNNAGIRCGEGSVLTIDDELDNRLANGGEAKVEGEKVVEPAVLVGGKEIAAGTASTELDSANPGTLAVVGGGYAPGIGGSPAENGGTMTFNGGNLDVRTYGWDFSGEGGASYSAGIGAAGSADGTATVMTFNGGTIHAYGGLHGAGIGAGHSGHDGDVGSRQPNAIPSRGTTRCTGDNPNVAGNITINGGYIYSQGGWHGGAFGSACWSSNKGKTIKVTGGTLIPVPGSGGGGAHTGDYNVFPEIGGSKGYVEITGGSVRCSDPATRFQGIGSTAWGNSNYLEPGYNTGNPNDPNKVFMVTIDLSSEIKGNGAAGNNLIWDWELLVANEPYNYGAPQQFDNGKLYLWLPKSATQEQVTVNLSYIDDEGKVQKINPLFRNPGQVDTLKRYIDFELPKTYTDHLSKYYDGLPFEAYDLGGTDENGNPNAITTKEDMPKTLNDPCAVDWRYQRFTERGGQPLGPEVSDNNQMPSDVGVMRFVMTSTQYSNNTAPEYKDFRENYWGHRAYGWCDISPVPSSIKLVDATWVEDSQKGDIAHDSRKALQVTCEIEGGVFEDGTHTADTCKAPHGRIQLFIDDEPQGDPIPILFQDTEVEVAEKTALKRASAAKAGTKVLMPKNATEVPNGKGGSTTVFNYVFTPADSDYLVPKATGDNKHEVSVQFLRPDADYQGPANYLESTNPAENDSVPSAEVHIDPVDPKPQVTADSLPDGTSFTPVEGVNDPEAISGHGSLHLIYHANNDDGSPAGEAVLKVKSPSSGAFTLTDSNGGIVRAYLRADDSGNPIQNADGTYDLIVDPEAVGQTELHLTQEANGAYLPSHFVYDITVDPAPDIPPAPKLDKQVVNLTHPDGPTQPGDLLAYQVMASNEREGSVWEDALVTDQLPACLTLAADKPVHLTNNNTLAPFSGELTQVAAAADAPASGQYSVATAANGQQTVKFFMGDIIASTEQTPQSATVAFICRVNDDAPGQVLDNIATSPEAPTSPESPNTPIAGPATPCGKPGEKVSPADPKKDDLALAKSFKNLTHPDATGVQVGDKVAYSCTFTNNGAANSSLLFAAVSDPLPSGLTFIPGTLQLTDAAGATHQVPDSAYHADSHTIALSLGSLPGGTSATLTFQCQVNPEALEQPLANQAYGTGTLPSDLPAEKPDPSNPDDPSDPDDPTNPTDPDDPSSPSDPTKPQVPEEPGLPVDPALFDEPLASSAPVEPDSVIPADATSKDMAITKEAANLSHTDATYEGDIIRYTLTAKALTPGAGWMEVVLRDQLPQGLDYVAGSAHLRDQGGTLYAPTDAIFDPATRTLAVYGGHLWGGHDLELTFEARVNHEGVGADIGNVAYLGGHKPSQWKESQPSDGDDSDKPNNPNSRGPKPGDPASGSELWDEFASSNLVIQSSVAYPVGADVTQGGAVLPAPDGKTVAPAGKVAIPKTGDESLLPGIIGLAVAALLGSGVVLQRRRS